MIRVGQGYDVHRLETGETLWLGGILIPHHKGTVAHSDGDVLIHAICDALLGALGLGDIGTLFPDTSSQFKDIDSKILLKKTTERIKKEGFELVNIDATLCMQQPKVNPYIQEMKRVLAGVLEVDEGQISIKATTTEWLGFEGREEGVSALAVALLQNTKTRKLTGKKTLVIGASPKVERYSNKAMNLLKKYGHDVIGLAKHSGQTGDITIQTDFPQTNDIHTVTLYIGAEKQPEYYEPVLSLNPRRVIFNPGTENPGFKTILESAGIETVENCTLVMLQTGIF